MSHVLEWCAGLACWTSVLDLCAGLVYWTGVLLVLGLLTSVA